MTMRTVTIIVCVLDAAVWALVAFEMFASGSGPATSGLDEVAGYIMTALFLITHVPALAFVISSRGLQPNERLCVSRSTSALPDLPGSAPPAG